MEDNSRDAGSGDEIRRGVDNGRSADTTPWMVMFNPPWPGPGSHRTG